MLHCFQAAAYGAQDPWWHAPSWILEGSAEWAGATLSAPDSFDAESWQVYLTTPGADLRKRTYDATGFYAHLDETGHSPWTSFRKMWVTGTTSEAAFVAAGATDDGFLDSWASSTTRRDPLGTSWDTNGPGVTTDAPHREVLSVGKAAIDVKARPYAHALFDVVVGTDLLRVAVTGHGRIADGRVDATVQDASLFCVRDGGCPCPDGTGPEVPPMALSREGSSMALTGGPDGTAGTVQGFDLADICVSRSSSSGPLDACALVTDAEVLASIGVPVSRIEPHDDGANQCCIKGNERTADPSSFTYISVGVIHGGGALVDQSASAPGAQLVAGLGSRAVVLPSAGAAFVAIGEDVLTVQVVIGGRPGAADAVTTVARIAASRLGG
jgi:hypothetical protein